MKKTPPQKPISLNFDFFIQWQEVLYISFILRQLNKQGMLEET